MLHFELVCARIKLNVYTPGKYARILQSNLRLRTTESVGKRERENSHRLDEMKAF